MKKEVSQRTYSLAELGWHPVFDDYFAEYENNTFIPARVAREQRHSYLLLTEQGEMTSKVSGKMHHQANSKNDYPVVGDWVVIRPQNEQTPAIIQGILPRRTQFSRKVVGTQTEEQVLVANVDTIFIIVGLDHDFNLRRIERYLALTWECGARPIIVLNKMDLVSDLAEKIAAVEGVAFDVPILPVSAQLGDGMPVLIDHLKPGMTASLLGSSGVGKSTIINYLLDSDVQTVQEVRADDSRGRHTTTQREMFLAPQGGLMIDNPGMRELQLWVDEAQLAEAFEDVEMLIQQCRFSDCQHNTEPGCAINAAIENGTLDAARYQNYQKLLGEVRQLGVRKEERFNMEEKKKRMKQISKYIKEIKKSSKRR